MFCWLLLLYLCQAQAKYPNEEKEINFKPEPKTLSNYFDKDTGVRASMTSSNRRQERQILSPEGLSSEDLKTDFTQGWNWAVVVIKHLRFQPPYRLRIQFSGQIYLEKALLEIRPSLFELTPDCKCQALPSSQLSQLGYWNLKFTFQKVAFF